METLKPEPFEERKSQKLGGWDYFKEKVLWGILPFATGGAAMLFGKITKFSPKFKPLDGSPDLITLAHAKIAEHFTQGNEEVKKEAVKWIKDGGFFGPIIDLAGEKKDTARKYFFNFVKGFEVATPFAVYKLWHRNEENRLDLQEASDRLHKLEGLKPSDAELAKQNDVMRKELAFAASNPSPSATIDAGTAAHQGRVVERQQALV